MKVAVFDSHGFEKNYFIEQSQLHNHELIFLQTKLDESTAVLAKGCEAACIFVNDRANRKVLTLLKSVGVKLIALRSAGFNHVDLIAAKDLGLTVVRVPEYSPYAVAEHAVALLMTLNRKIHKAYNRVREANFSLDGLTGFDLHGKTVGVVGTGRIGYVFCKIMLGFGTKVLAVDPSPNQKLISMGVSYCDLSQVLEKSDIISLHLPLSKNTHHLINSDAFRQMKPGVIIINSSRGGLIDTKSLIDNLKSNHIAGAALDVYEEEEGLFFSDHSSDLLQDDVLARLLTFPNVLLTSHQAFLTKEALNNIATTTMLNISQYEKGLPLTNSL